MKPFFWIFGTGIMISLIYGMIDGRFKAVGFGLGGLWIGILYLFIGLVLLILKDKKLSAPFMLSGLVLFLIGVTSCSLGAMGQI